MPEREPLRLLRTHLETGFVQTGGRRFHHETAPDRSPGPRFRLEGCVEGNAALVRSDVPDGVAAELLHLADEEPPLADAEALPRHLPAYLELLSVEGEEPEHGPGLTWVFHDGIEPDASVDLIRSGTSPAAGLADRIPETMHSALVDRGFRSFDALWPPWVMAVDGGTIVAIAETVRRGPHGAEVGVDTAPGHRGRGLGAAVTAAWSTHVELRGLTRYYGTSRANTSSRRLVERLGLRFLGSSFDVV